MSKSSAGRRVAYLLIALAIIIIACIVWFSLPAAYKGGTKLSPDLYPLYNGVTWSAPEGTSLSLSTTTLKGEIIRATAATNTMNIASATNPYSSYYQQKLLASGWKVDSSLTAGGPGSEQIVYRKDSSVVVLSFSSVFHNNPGNQPEQCPCDVTLSLFSSDGAVD